MNLLGNRVRAIVALTLLLSLLTPSAFALEQLRAPAGNQGASQNATTTTAVTNLVVSAGPTRVFTVTGYNNKGSSQYIQLHDATSLPADNAVPKVVIVAAANSNFTIDFGVYGRFFSTGLVICNSSTLATKTIGSADIWVDVQHVPSGVGG